MPASILAEKSYSFAVRIVRLYQFLIREQKEYVLSRQLLRSGTAIGALVSEAGFGQSDFISKLAIASKEASETAYWLRLLHDTEYLEVRMFQSLDADVQELLRLLTASLKTARANPAFSKH